MMRRERDQDKLFDVDMLAPGDYDRTRFPVARSPFTSALRALLPALVLLAASHPACAWPCSSTPRVLSSGLEGDADRCAVVLRFSGEPQVTFTADERNHTMIVDFAAAQLATGARLFTPNDLVEAAGLEQIAPETLRLVMRIRRDTTVTILRSAPETPGYTCAVVVADEMGDLGPGAAAITWPVRGRLSSKYGMRMHPILHTERMHQGIDIAVPTGTPVRAMSAGIVTWAGWQGASGLCVSVHHANGMESSYKHCSKLRVTSGQRVKRHQILGEAGSTGMSTGPHVHLTVTQNGKLIDPARLMRKKR